MTQPRPPRRVSRPPALVAAVTGVVVLALVGGGAWWLLRDDGPGLDEAERTVTSYVRALEAHDCGHLALASERRRADLGDPTRDECLQAVADSAGEYEEYEVGKVRLRGDHAEAEVQVWGEPPLDLVYVLVVEDGEWRVDEVREVE